MTDQLPVHSTRGASGAYRWFNCPGAPAAEARCPDEDTRFALEGTAAHRLSDMCWAAKTRAQTYLGTTIHVAAKDGTIHEFEVTQEMASAVDEYQDAIRELVDEEAGDIWHHEVRVNLNAVTGRDDTYGTADDLIFKPSTSRLIIGDLKYGRGILVEVRDNRQLRYYAVGGVIEAERLGWQVHTVTTLIGQPRMYHEDGVIRSETYDASDLLEFIGELKAALKRTDDPNAPRVAGSWCHFCRAAAVCPENKALALATAQAAFAPGPPVIKGPEGLPVIEQLTSEQVGWLLRRADVIDNWIKAVRRYGASEAEAGRCPASYKLGRSRTNRMFPKEKRPAVVTLLTDYGFAEKDLFIEPQLKSPAQIETLLKADPETRKGGIRASVKGELTAYIEKPEGAWILVPEESPKASKEEELTAGFQDTTKNQ